MGLPKVTPPTRTIELSSASITLRGLSRGEAVRMANHGEDVAALEADLISCATDVPMAEAREWHNTAPSADVQKIVEAVISLSGLDGELGKARSAA